MKILLINPPHPAIGSRIPHEHLPPLGLLALGGPLIDAGHIVRLLDAEFGPMSREEIVENATRWNPRAILIGHSGSTSAHPVVAEVTRALRRALPAVWIIYGGVFPTFHWHEILEAEPQIDFVVRGEGEETIVRLMAELNTGSIMPEICGIAYRQRNSGAGGGTRFVCAPPAPKIKNLDDYRVGWELIDHSRYTYWGDKRAVVVQFSRGCPHLCSYCGQRVFWRTWRHREPGKFAAELARLHREHGVEVINFADENPTANREVWKQFLEALIAQDVKLTLVGSTRADDIVRDADILHLHKKAGVARWLMGMESTDEATLQRIRKGSTRATDKEAIRLLRAHGIISMSAWVCGFTDQKDGDYWRTLRQILAYDPDQVQALYATPHRWTQFCHQQEEKPVVQEDLRLWDYKHQVLASQHVPAWRVMLWMKLTEAVAQLRPKSLWRLLFHPESQFRAAMRWYYRIGAKVWPYEIRNWLTKDRRKCGGLSVKKFWRSVLSNSRAEVCRLGYTPSSQGTTCSRPAPPHRNLLANMRT